MIKTIKTIRKGPLSTHTYSTVDSQYYILTTYILKSILYDVSLLLLTCVSNNLLLPTY
jgi:hypothetical protein